MRLLTINLLATALLLFGAANASAFSITASSNYDGVSVLGVSDTVTIDVFIDATETGLSLLSISVTADEAIMVHVPTPACGGVFSPSPGCGSPTYILYSPAAGSSSATILYPQQNPFAPWTGIKPPGLEQININYAEAALGDGQATGVGIWVASVTFHVADLGDGLAEMAVSVLNNGNIVRINGVNQDLNTIAVNGSPGEFGFTVLTPEPTTALLVGLGLVGLGVAGRRRE